MKGPDRKAAISAYKEQKVSAGIYAVRCIPTGETWIGSTPNLGAIWTRLSFGLRQGDHKGRTLQDAFDRHGPDGFAFEVVETIEEESDAHIQASILKKRLAHWRAELSAEPIL